MSKQRVAPYARVQTTDKGQNPENQLVLRRKAERVGNTICKEYIEE